MNEKRDINVVISNILKAGVFVSSFFIVTGIVLGFVTGVNESIAIERYTFSEIYRSLSTNSSSNLITR